MKSTTALIVSLLVVIAGVVVLSFDVGQSQSQTIAQATSTEPTSTAPSIIASTTVSNPRPTPPRQAISSSRVPPSNPTVTIEPVQPPQIPPAKPAFSLCRANNLTGMAHWQGATGSIVGTLLISDSSRSPCSLSHDDYLQIMSGDHVLSVIQSGNGSAGAYTDLYPGQSIPLDFSWSNWCGGDMVQAAYVRLILPQNGGYLSVPLIDPNGTPQSDTPRCDAPGSYSYVSIWQ